MLFYHTPLKPNLKIFQMPREDSRTYITERVEHLLPALEEIYKVKVGQTTHYLGVKFDQCMVFEHSDGMFKVIDWSDSDQPDKMESTDIIHHPKCQFVLKCQYNPAWHVPKLRPFFYFEKTKPRQFSSSLHRLRKIPKVGDKLFWRGNMHVGREPTLRSISDLLNTGYDEIIDGGGFYEELASHRVAISLPGLGKSCHREFECFGIGTVVLSPVFQNTYYAPLIPNHHYLAVDPCDPKDLPEMIRIRLDRTSQEEIENVRMNAMEYYDTYIRFESSINWLFHLLELYM
jgi:hypothetical protein